MKDKEKNVLGVFNGCFETYTRQSLNFRKFRGP